MDCNESLVEVDSMGVLAFRFPNSSFRQLKAHYNQLAARVFSASQG